MPTRNIYDVLHHVSTKLMDGRIVTETTTLVAGVDHDTAELTKAQHEALNKFGFYDVAYVGRQWVDEPVEFIEDHQPVGLL